MPRILPVLAFILAACTKSGGGTASNAARDTTAPVVSLLSPTANQAFKNGQTIQVSASATDNVKLTELHIHVLNSATGALLRDIHSYPAAMSGTVQDAFTAQAGMDYIIKIIALDPSQNLTTAQVDVSVN